MIGGGGDEARIAAAMPWRSDTTPCPAADDRRCLVYQISLANTRRQASTWSSRSTARTSLPNPPRTPTFRSGGGCQVSMPSARDPHRSCTYTSCGAVTRARARRGFGDVDGVARLRQAGAFLLPDGIDGLMR
jgi:hypothetical protein